MMVVNFSQEEVVIPRATVVGVAEEISPSLVAAINDRKGMSGGNEDEEPQSVNTVADKVKFSTYLQGVLNHLREHEKAVMEPVLRKYSHVFHIDEDSQFTGSDLVEHRIVTGDARPI